MKKNTKRYNINAGDVIVGLIISQEEENIIGVIKATPYTPVDFEPGACLEAETIDYSVVETDNMSPKDLVSVKEYEEVMKDLIALDKKEVIKLSVVLNCVYVSSSYFWR
jgi:hypothetical protein